MAGAAWVTHSVGGTWTEVESVPDIAELLPSGLGATACLLGIAGLVPRRRRRPWLIRAPLLLAVLGIAGLALQRHVMVTRVLAELPAELLMPPWVTARGLVAAILAHQQTLQLGLMWNGLGLFAAALGAAGEVVGGDRPRRIAVAGWVVLGGLAAAVVLLIPVLRASYAWKMVWVVGAEGIAQLPYWVGYYLQHFATMDALRRLPTLVPMAALLVLFPLLAGRLLPSMRDDGLDSQRGAAAAGLVGGVLCLGLSAHHAAAAQVLQWCHAAAFSTRGALFGSTAYYDYHAISGIPATAVVVGFAMAAPLVLMPRRPLGPRLAGFPLLIAAVALLACSQTLAVSRVSDALPPDQEKGYTLWDAATALLQLEHLPPTWDEFSGWYGQLSHPSWVAESADRRVPELAVSGEPPEARLLTVSTHRIVLVGDSSNFGRRWDQDLAIVQDGALVGGHTETIPAVEDALDRVTSDHWEEQPDTDPVLNVAADRSTPMSTITVVRNAAWEAGVDAPAFLVARSGRPYHPNYGAMWMYTPPREGLVEGTPVWVLTVLPDGVVLREPDGAVHRATRAHELVSVVSGRASRNAVLVAVHDDRATLGDYLAAVVALSSVELFPVVFHAWVSVQEQPARLAEVRAAEQAARTAPSEHDWRTELAYRTVGDVVVGPVPTDWWVEEGEGQYRRMRRPPQ